MLKFRDRPCEAPIVCRVPNRSTSVTWRPRRARCQAVADPIAPPPTTTTVSRRAAMGPVSSAARQHPEPGRLADHPVAVVDEQPGDVLARRQRPGWRLFAGSRDVAERQRPLDPGAGVAVGQVAPGVVAGTTTP